MQLDGGLQLPTGGRYVGGSEIGLGEVEEGAFQIR